jgi:hypothetical protein
MEIELYEKMTNPLDAIVQIGRMFAKSGMFGCEKEEQGQVLALICMTEKRSPVDINRSYDIVDGKLRKKSLASLADFRAKGGKHKWIKTGEDGKEAEIKLTIDGETITSKFTMEDAQKQGLIKPRSNWEKSPQNMLRARAVSNGVAMLCPEIFAGDDSESDEPRSTAPLLPEKPKSEPKVEAKPEAKTEPKEKAIEVEAKVETKSEEKSEPVKKFMAADVRLDPSGKRLSDESVIALLDAIGEVNHVAAFEWLKAKKWIVSGLHEISVERARRILEKPEAFIGYVKGK